MKTAAAALQNTVRSLMGISLLVAKPRPSFERSVAGKLGLVPQTSGLNISIAVRKK
jgi:hypothetical protein